MTEKGFISAESLLRDSMELATRIVRRASSANS
jgi:hypothetical protein